MRLVLLALLLGTARASEPASIDPTGVWVLEYRVSTRAEVPILGSIGTQTTNIVLVEIEREGDAWVQHHLLCSSITRGGLARSELPARFLARIGPREYPISVEVGAGLTAYEADTGAFFSGYDPSCGELPESMDDPCVTDWDADGIAGATARVKPPLLPWAEVYVAQHNHITLSGAVVDEDTVEGSVQIRALQTRVLGASNPRYVRNPEIAFDRDGSRFLMERAQQARSCHDIALGLR